MSLVRYNATAGPQGVFDMYMYFERENVKADDTRIASWHRCSRVAAVVMLNVATGLTSNSELRARGSRLSGRLCGVEGMGGRLLVAMAIPVDAIGGVGISVGGFSLD